MHRLRHEGKRIQESGIAHNHRSQACRVNSMELNERVITVLFSSARKSRIVSLANSSNGWPLAQVMASVGIPRVFSASAAATTSEVCPEREISTGTQFPAETPSG